MLACENPEDQQTDQKAASSTARADAGRHHPPNHRQHHHRFDQRGDFTTSDILGQSPTSLRACECLFPQKKSRNSSMAPMPPNDIKIIPTAWTNPSQTNQPEP